MGNEHYALNEKRTLKDKLMAVVLLESVKKYKDLDDAFTIECVDFLIELEKEKRITVSEVDQSVGKISFVEKIHDIKVKANKKRRLKTLGIVATVLAVMFSIFAISAVASGDDPDALVNKWIRVVSEMLENKILYVGDNVTFIKAT